MEDDVKPKHKSRKGTKNDSGPIDESDEEEQSPWNRFKAASAVLTLEDEEVQRFFNSERKRIEERAPEPVMPQGIEAQLALMRVKAAGG